MKKALIDLTLAKALHTIDKVPVHFSKKPKKISITPLQNFVSTYKGPESESKSISLIRFLFQIKKGVL